jgi:hypothetical protein
MRSSDARLPIAISLHPAADRTWLDLDLLPMCMGKSAALD